MKFKKPPLRLQPTTLWDYPSQHYGEGQQGSQTYRGATPSYVIWNLISRYTQPKDLVIDPFCGSGTTLDVARDLNRRALGYDLNPQRPDIFRVDARKLPPELTGKVDCVFMDPPYSTHIDYSDDPRCIGKLDAGKGRAYYEAMEGAISEAHRVLKPGGHFGLYVSDSYEHKGGKGMFHPIGFELFGLMQKQFIPVDVVCVTRHNKTLEMGNFRAAAEEGISGAGQNHNHGDSPHHAGHKPARSGYGRQAPQRLPSARQTPAWPDPPATPSPPAQAAWTA